MGKKLLIISVKGKDHSWSFEFYADPKYLEDWREDGLEVDEVCNTIPAWLPVWGISLWCGLQDIWNFRIPGRW